MQKASLPFTSLAVSVASNKLKIIMTKVELVSLLVIRIVVSDCSKKTK